MGKTTLSEDEYYDRIDVVLYIDTLQGSINMLNLLLKLSADNVEIRV